MIETPERMRALTSDLGMSVWTVGAIGALLESGLVEHLREPRTVDELASRCPTLSPGQIEGCLGVAVVAGVIVADGGRHRLADGALPFSQAPLRATLAGDIRANLMQALALLDASRGARARTGWDHTDPALLQSQGDASSGLVPMMKAHIVPALDDLGARLERPGARFLDIGVGVAAIAIAMCRAFPQLGAVGLDVSEAPLALARRNVEAAELAQRIELRKDHAENLRDEAAFDLAWLPAFFIPNVVATLPRVHAALRAGGWILVGTAASGGTDQQRAVWALLREQWGGAAIGAAQAEELLRGAGFASVRTLPGPPWAPSMVVGQRS